VGAIGVGGIIVGGRCLKAGGTIEVGAVAFTSSGVGGVRGTFSGGNTVVIVGAAGEVVVITGGGAVLGAFVLWVPGNTIGGGSLLSANRRYSIQ